jgi:hypothetical protein
MPIAQRLDGRLDDVAGRFEVRLPNTEIDYVRALTRQRFRLRQNLERGFGAQPLHTGCRYQTGH